MCTCRPPRRRCPGPARTRLLQGCSARGAAPPVGLLRPGAAPPGGCFAGSLAAARRAASLTGGGTAFTFRSRTAIQRSSPTGEAALWEKQPYGRCRRACTNVRRQGSAAVRENASAHLARRDCRGRPRFPPRARVPPHASLGRVFASALVSPRFSGPRLSRCACAKIGEHQGSAVGDAALRAVRRNASSHLARADCRGRPWFSSRRFSPTPRHLVGVRVTSLSASPILGRGGTVACAQSDNAVGSGQRAKQPNGRCARACVCVCVETLRLV